MKPYGRGFGHTEQLGWKKELRPVRWSIPPLRGGLRAAVSRLPIAVMTVAMVLCPMCGVLVIGVTVCGTYLLDHTHRASLMVMMRVQTQQEQHGHGQEYAICDGESFHAAKLTIYSCK